MSSASACPAAYQSSVVGDNDMDSHDAAQMPTARIAARNLPVDRSRVGPEIVLDDENEAELLDGGEVDAFIGDAGGLAAITDVGKGGDVPALQASTQTGTGEDGDEIAQG